MNGWYKQHRNLSTRAWFKDPCMVQLYHYLKERAYVIDSPYEGIMIRRGSCPVTRSELVEVTGMSYATLNRKLKKLISYGEIIIKANNHFTVITVCDYDSCNGVGSLFDTTDDIASDTTSDTAGDTTSETTHLLYKERRIYKEDNNLISPYSPYKKDKEGLAYEIKERWNRTFDGKLKRVERLTMPTRTMVDNCVSRFGRQSVDLVFEQVALEHERTGFVASFQFVFEQINYQGYLKRAQIRLSNKNKEPGKQDPEPPKANGSWLDAYNENPNWKPNIKK